MEQRARYNQRISHQCASRHGVVRPCSQGSASDNFRRFSCEKYMLFAKPRDALLLVIGHFAGTVAQILCCKGKLRSVSPGSDAPAHPRGSLGMEFLEEMFNFDGIMVQARPRGPGRRQTALLM